MALVPRLGPSSLPRLQHAPARLPAWTAYGPAVAEPTQPAPSVRTASHSACCTKAARRAEAGPRPRGTHDPLATKSVEREALLLLTVTAATLSGAIWDPQFSSINALNLKTSSPNYTLGTKKAKAFPGASYSVVLCCPNSWPR